MRIVVLGGTGFVGTAMSASLLGQGHTVLVASRQVTGLASNHLYAPERAAWDGRDVSVLTTLLEGSDAVINLVGENIAQGRWTPARRQSIRQSRQVAGEAVTTALTQMHRQGQPLPHSLLQASAVGYYGLWEDARSAPRCTEQNPAGAGFLAETCVGWEAATAEVGCVGVRRCVLRLAPIVGRAPSGAAGGFLQRMVGPYHYFLGGPAGSGRQPMSWVHMSDVLGVVDFLLHNPEMSGVFNVSAPQCVNMREFASALGQVLRRPALLRVPAMLLRWMLGDMADELVLSGQCAPPVRLLQNEYIFQQPYLLEALREVLE